jgi:hypothetical protein
MSVALDHVILSTNDQRAFVSKMLVLPDGVPVGHFICIPLGSSVTIDVMESEVHDRCTSRSSSTTRRSIEVSPSFGPSTYPTGPTRARPSGFHQSLRRRPGRVLRRPRRQQPRTTHPLDGAAHHAVRDVGQRHTQRVPGRLRSRFLARLLDVPVGRPSAAVQTVHRAGARPGPRMGRGRSRRHETTDDQRPQRLAG